MVYAFLGRSSESDIPEHHFPPVLDTSPPLDVEVSWQTGVAPLGVKEALDPRGWSESLQLLLVGELLTVSDELEEVSCDVWVGLDNDLGDQNGDLVFEWLPFAATLVLGIVHVVQVDCSVDIKRLDQVEVF